MRLRYPFFIVPVCVAVAANLVALGLLELVEGQGLDGAQLLLPVAGVAAVVSALGVAAAQARARGEAPVGVGLLTGMLTFAVAWVPPLVLVLLYPPT